MLEADEDPEAFAEHLRIQVDTQNEETIAAFRSLLIASMEAVAASAVEPIALVGRQYLRKECPAWIARGWLRLLTELVEPELAGLRDIAAKGLQIAAYLASQQAKLRIAFTLHGDSQDARANDYLLPVGIPLSNKESRWPKATPQDWSTYWFRITSAKVARLIFP